MGTEPGEAAVNGRVAKIIGCRLRGRGLVSIERRIGTSVIACLCTRDTKHNCFLISSKKGSS